LPHQPYQHLTRSNRLRGPWDETKIGRTSGAAGHGRQCCQFSTPQEFGEAPASGHAAAIAEPPHARTNAARIFDRLVGDIESDLGGRDQLTAIERSLVEAYAGAALVLDNLNARLLRGEAIDISEHAQAVSAMVRVAARLGIRRRQRDVTPSLRDYLEAKPDDAEATE